MTAPVPHILHGDEIAQLGRPRFVSSGPIRPDVSVAEALNVLFYAVREFHKTFDQPAPDVPTMQTPDLVARRGDWIVEEKEEVAEATTVEDQADGYIDGIYFNLGGLVELGVLPGELLELAHKANMAKRHTIDGKLTVVKNEQGKVLKPADWVDPTPAQRAEVQRQMQALPLAA